MNLDRWPLFDALEDCERVLLAGAGGGFDIFSGLPLLFALEDAGKQVSLANLSFASLPREEEHRVTPQCVAVTADVPCHGTYFPEYHLAQWFRQRHDREVTVYAFPQTGVVPLLAAYRKLVELLDLDAVVLVDGGTDSLMRGDEFLLGTPEEDIASIAAVAACGVEKTFLTCIGFGVDSFHGVCHAQFLEAVADLSQKGAYLGVASVLPEMHGAAEFLSAVEFANEKNPHRQSIVANSIASAIEGRYGDHHRTQRTSGSELWINPLMPLYWAFNLPAVAERNLYIDHLSETETMMDITQRIAMFRSQIGDRGWDHIPV